MIQIKKWTSTGHRDQCNSSNQFFYTLGDAQTGNGKNIMLTFQQRLREEIFVVMSLKVRRSW